MNQNKQQKDHLEWRSEVSLEQVFKPSKQCSHPQLFDDQLLYLGSATDEHSNKIRSVVFSAKLSAPDEHPRSLIPAPFECGSRIHEYGGKSFWLFEQSLFFINKSDQGIYSIDLGSSDSASDLVPRLIYANSGSARRCFADLQLIQPNLLLAICESHSETGEEPVASIVAIQIGLPSPMIELVSGADFYSNLVYEPSSGHVAWVQWNHPHMPWDENHIGRGRLELSRDNPAIVEQRILDNLRGASHCQLVFADQRLFCAADFSEGLHAEDDFWNLHEVDAESGLLRKVTSLDYELGYPHWQFGDHRLVAWQANKLLAIASCPEYDELWMIDLSNNAIDQRIEARGSLQGLSVDEAGQAVFLEHPKSSKPHLVRCRLADDESLEFNKLGAPEWVAALDQIPLVDNRFELSQARHIKFPVDEKDHAYGFYYPPANSRYECDAAPPLLVMVHGGPTARAYGHFDLQKQYWTSSGFAVLDVNHRGSSGYGRRFRDALYGHWGERDCEDIIAGILSLIEQNLADPERIVIRGKSAGGYAVLRALTQAPEVFAAGACYYGIGDLVTLAETTHKFEKYYTDQLIGEVFDPLTPADESSCYHQRSPIHDISSIKAAMIVFQGGQDAIVPPQLAHEVVAELESNEIECQYIEFADEGHGFRQPTNNMKAWQLETDFYRACLAS
ncbi:MAG: prolyl oligopeptidase family serine peptidase [Pseudomonadota bacterium]